MSDASRPKRFELARGTGTGTRIATGLVGFILTLLAGLLALQRPGRNLVSLSYDLPFIYHKAGASGDIAIVYIDTLDAQNDEVLDRSLQAPLLDALGAAGAKALVYDIIFEQPSRDPQVDRDFAAAMRRFRGVDENGTAVPGAPRRSVFLAFGRDTFQDTGMSGEILIPATDELLDAADDFGLALYADDAFGARKLTTGTIDEPSLAWKAATVLGTPLPEESRPDPRWINFAGPPVDPDNPDAKPAFLSIKASSVLIWTAPDLLRDKIVVVGGKPGIVGAALGKDLFKTPFHRFQPGGKYPLMSGVEIQANMLENLRRGNWLTRAGRGLDLTLVILTALLASIVFSRVRPMAAIMIAIASSLLLIVAGIWSIRVQGVWFAWSVPAFLQLPVALGWVSGAKYYLERSRRRRLGEAFAKVVSPEMLRQIAAEGYKLELGGERITAALMFTDLADFTTMSEDVGDPVEILRHLNIYFEATTEHIFTHHGAVIQFVGDAIYAAWGAPVPIPHAPREAARAAWKLSRSSGFEVVGRTRTHRPRTRIGLHYGEVVSGIAGSSKHMAYSLMGDSTNLAARLEGLNKLFGTNILCSEDLHRELGDEFHTRRVGRFCVKGRDEPTTIYELVGLRKDGDSPPAWIADYHDAIKALETNDPERARELLEALIARRKLEDGTPTGDGPSAFFLEHLATVKSITDGIVHLNVK